MGTEMKAKIFTMLTLCMLPMVSHAAIPYRVEQVEMPTVAPVGGHDNQAFARRHRFYIGASYNFSMWDSYTDDKNVRVSGKNTSSFDVSAGVRLYDVFRLEANYINTRAEWNAFSLTGHTGMINAIVDARIDNIYRIFRSQHIVPYVGVGAGLNWNSPEDVHIENKISPVVAAIAGIGFDFGEHFTIDLGYKYFYMFTPEFDAVADLAPSAHQLRAGVRMNF